MSVHAQSCPTLWEPMDCSPPGSSVHGISQARILVWVAMPFSRISSWPRDRTRNFYISCIGWRILYNYATWEACIKSLTSSKFLCPFVNSLFSSLLGYTSSFKEFWICIISSTWGSIPSHFIPSKYYLIFKTQLILCIFHKVPNFLSQNSSFPLVSLFCFDNFVFSPILKHIPCSVFCHRHRMVSWLKS